jgi:hypothetical protein
MMPSSASSFASAGFVAVVVLLGACKSSSSPAPKSEPSGTTTVATTTTTAAGGAGGAGGSGGAPSSGGSGGTSAGGAGGAGGASCIHPEGTGETDITACGKTKLGFAPHDCGPDKNQPPPATLACMTGFSVFTAGAAEALAACLVQIPDAELCEESRTKSCLATVYAGVCEVPAVANACQNVKDTFCTNGDAFDVAACTERMRPFANGALVDVVNCVQQADPSLACQARFDTCVADRSNGF